MPGNKGQTMAESHRRLEAEAWLRDARITAALRADGATSQPHATGSGPLVFDEYSIIVEKMPGGITPEQFVVLLASDLNKTINDGMFDGVNRFTRRNRAAPRIGEIVDIDIFGPENCSVMLVELTPTYFVYHTIKTKKHGGHPECGAREFGFERLADGTVKLYTRAVFKAANVLVEIGGPAGQAVSWSRLCRGMSDSIDAVGGKARPNSFRVHKHTKAPPPRPRPSVDWSRKMCCFAAGTQVWSDAGLCAIESVAVGGRVYAPDPVTEKPTLCTVTEVDVHHGRFDLRSVELGRGASVEVTPEHRFAQARGPWTPTDALEGRSVLEGATGNAVIERITTGRTVERVFNLRVAEFASYYVGHSGVLVRDH